MDRSVDGLIEKSKDGTTFDRGDVLQALALDSRSDEVVEIEEAALSLGRKVIGNFGFVHAQIGIDNTPCPMNCQYCAFAKINRHDSEHYVLNAKTVSACTRAVGNAGVNLVSLMATAALSHKDLLGFVEAARAAASDDVVLMVNVSDMSLEQARDYKNAGADAAYHAVRLGEGRYTGISPERRMRTIENIQEAGLALMAGVEPVWSGFSNEEIADAIMLMPKLHPVWTGACGLSPVKGTLFENAGSLDIDRVRQVGALIRLVSQDEIPVGGVGGVVWVDAGADPRDRHNTGDEDMLKDMVVKAQEKLKVEGWMPASQSESIKLVERKR